MHPKAWVEEGEGIEMIVVFESDMQIRLLAVRRLCSAGTQL